MIDADCVFRSATVCDMARMIVPSCTSLACPRAVLSMPENCRRMSPGIVFHDSASVMARWMVAFWPTISPKSPTVTTRSGVAATA